MSIVTLLGCLLLGVAFTILAAAVILGCGALFSSFKKMDFTPDEETEKKMHEQLTEREE